MFQDMCILCLRRTVLAKDINTGLTIIYYIIGIYYCQDIMTIRDRIGFFQEILTKIAMYYIILS